MQNNALVMLYFLVILILSACNNVEVEENPLSESEDVSANQSEIRDEKAKILKVTTDLEKKNGWYIVPEGVNTMTISVEVENVETILFWITPTGTEVWGERKLIGYDIDENDGWSFNWEFGDRIFHDHITIQVLGSDGATQAKETFNVHSIDEITNESDKKIEEQVSSESELELSKREMIQEGEVRVFDDTYLAESILDDLNGDGIEDEINMYISPPPIFNEQGEAAWDDSHVWQLIVSINGKSYSLFDESARGLLDFWTVGDDGERELVLFESGQSLILYKYKFADNHFIKEIILYEEFVNKRSLSDW